MFGENNLIKYLVSQTFQYILAVVRLFKTFHWIGGCSYTFGGICILLRFFTLFFLLFLTFPSNGAQALRMSAAQRLRHLGARKPQSSPIIQLHSSGSLYPVYYLPYYYKSLVYNHSYVLLLLSHCFWWLDYTYWSRPLNLISADFTDFR